MRDADAARVGAGAEGLHVVEFGAVVEFLVEGRREPFDEPTDAQLACPRSASLQPPGEASQDVEIEVDLRVGARALRLHDDGLPAHQGGGMDLGERRRREGFGIDF